MSYLRVLFVFLFSLQTVMVPFAQASGTQVQDTAELRLVEKIMASANSKSSAKDLDQAFESYLKDPQVNPEKATDNVIEALNVLGLADTRYNGKLKEAVASISVQLVRQQNRLDQLDDKERVKEIQMIFSPLSQVVIPSGNLYSAEDREVDTCWQLQVTKVFLLSFLAATTVAAIYSVPVFKSYQTIVHSPVAIWFHSSLAGTWGFSAAPCSSKRIWH